MVAANDEEEMVPAQQNPGQLVHCRRSQSVRVVFVIEPAPWSANAVLAENPLKALCHRVKETWSELCEEFCENARLLSIS